MNRLVIALALAAFPLIATAQQKSQAVTITNPVVPVEVRNANPVTVVQAPATITPAQMLTLYGTVGNTGTSINGGIAIQADAILTGLMLDLRTAGTSGDCSIVFSLRDSSFQTIVTAVAQLTGRAGEWRSSGFIPLPSIAVPAGSYVWGTGSNSTGQECKFGVVIHGLKN